MTEQDIKLTREFQLHTTRAILAIVFFSLSYLVILLLAMAITALSVYAGISLIVARPMFVTIALGIGLSSMGVLILIFLLKFAFKAHKVDRSHLLEVKKAEEPELFALIEEIVNEVDTDFPKMVYLSADVNAGVFYDSNFWSMFFPVKKNLQIGLGLVNTVTRSELKAILAHEFGHFSQKTMKVGSYVYNVNQVIFNMLFENDNYDKLIQSWANASGIFSIFAVIAFKTVQGIQWVLRKLYNVVNTSYMGLSREMEFHADEIAASVAGYEPLKTALLRSSLGEESFNQAVNFYEEKITENKKSENLYREQFFVLNFQATQNGISLKNGFPELSVDDLTRFNKSLLVIEDQWASHPSTEERIKRLELKDFPATETNQSPANEIFSNSEGIQEVITERTFNSVEYKGPVQTLSFEEFEKAYALEYSNNTFSKMYNGYYDHKNPIHFEMDSTYIHDESLNVNQLFSDEQVDQVYTALALQSDIETLKQIADKSIPVKTFDYDGIKHKRKDARKLITDLETNLESVNEDIKKNDVEIFRHFQSLEESSGKSLNLRALYEDFFAYDKVFDIKYEPYAKLSNALHFVSFTTPYDQIRANFLEIEPLEAELKSHIREMLDDRMYQDEMTQEIKESFESYLTRKLKYFGNETYFENNLNILYSAMNNYAFLLSKGYFLMKKQLLRYQEELINTSQPQQSLSKLG